MTRSSVIWQQLQHIDPLVENPLPGQHPEGQLLPPKKLRVPRSIRGGRANNQLTMTTRESENTMLGRGGALTGEAAERNDRSGGLYLTILMLPSDLQTSLHPSLY